MEVKTIGVVGAGAMGTGIAQVAVQAGFRVILHDLSPRLTDKALAVIAGNLDRAIAKGKASTADKEAVLGGIAATAELSRLTEADLIIEAVVEKEEIKTAVFRELDGICGPETIIVSNTSSISITRLGAATKRPDRVAGMHFFNPAQVMRLVEIIRGYGTSDGTVAILKTVVQRMGKTGIEVKKDTPGFVVNRLLLPQLREAYLLYEEGVASPEDIDTAIKLGLNHPMGPFELSDFTGLDIVHDVLCYYYREFGQPHYAPPISLKRLLNAGRTGRKAGGGWYDYK